MTDKELMQQALDAIVENRHIPEGWDDDGMGEVITALRERLAQPTQPLDDLMQEPMAWATTYIGFPNQFFKGDDAEGQAKAEIERLDRKYPQDKNKRAAKPLYTADQMREYAKKAVEAERERLSTSGHVVVQPRLPLD